MKRTVTMVILGCVVGLVGMVATGCGEKPDELGPYVEAFEAMDTYHEQLVSMEVALKADQPDMAARKSDIISEYLAAMDQIVLGKDKRILAGHNKVKRTLETALKKIVQPDFPTFPISAMKQIGVISEVVTIHINTLGRRWEEEARPTPFPLSYPGGD